MGSRVEEIRARLDAVQPGPWQAHDTEHDWSLHAGPYQILKAPKGGTPYAEYWPDERHAAFLVNAQADIAYLLQLVQEQDRDLAYAVKLLNRQGRGPQ